MATPLARPRVKILPLNDERRRAWPGFNQRQAAISADKAHRGVETIGIEPVTRDHRDGDVVDQTHARRRINDVRVPPAVDVEVLLAWTGCRNCRSRQLEHARHISQCGIAVVDVYSPAISSRWRIAEREISADRHETAANTAFTKDGERFTRGIALPNGANIERHARLIERHRLRARVNVELVESTATRRVAQCRRVGEPPFGSCRAPESNHRSLRYVERAARRFREFLRGSQYGAEVLAHMHGMLDGFAR